jgi:anti-anti-sigma factor
MELEMSLKMSDQEARMELSGDLDESSAHRFKELLDLAVARAPKRLILMMSGLGLIQTKNVRALICAKQRMGTQGEILLVGTQAGVLHTLRSTGFDRSVEFLEELPESAASK